MSKPYIFNKSGTWFDPSSGKLYEFTKSTVSVMVAYPQPKAWKKTTKRYPNWTRYRPSLHWLDSRLKYHFEKHGGYSVLAVNGEGYDLYDPWLRWYCTIPAEIQVHLNLFRTHKWHMLAFMAYGGQAAIDLVADNPALAFALASNWIFHKPAVQQPMRAVHRHLRANKSHASIIAWLGFSYPWKAEVILKKLSASEVNVSRLLTLRDMMTSTDVVNMLMKLPRLDGAVIYLLSLKSKGYLSQRFINDFMAIEGTQLNEEITTALSDSIKIHDAYKFYQEFPRMDSIRQLLQYRKQLSEEFEQ